MVVLPVIIAGGVGQRLWPVSNSRRPKPFAALFENCGTLFQRTMARAHVLSPGVRPLVVCNALHRDLVLQQAGVEEISLLLEPEPRDTAAAICAAAIWCADHFGESAVLAVMPADHFIEDHAAFVDSVSRASRAAKLGYIATLGIKPDRPATEYGYLQFNTDHDASRGFSEVVSFIEKPALDVAKTMYENPQYKWNSGMFVATAKTLLESFDMFAHDIAEVCQLSGSTQVDDQVWQMGDAFRNAPKISVDYAVMEKSPSIAGINATFDWRDLGTWTAIHAAERQDARGNHVSGMVQALHCHSSYLRSTTLLVRARNCSDLLVVEDDDGVLLMQLSQSSVMKSLTHDVARMVGPGETLAYDICGGQLTMTSTKSTPVKLIIHAPALRGSGESHATT